MLKRARSLHPRVHVIVGGIFEDGVCVCTTECDMSHLHATHDEADTNMTMWVKHTVDVIFV